MKDPKPRVILLLTYPRTASNLLTHTLSLDRQPNTISPWSGGYFFRPVVVNNTLPYPGKHVQTWTKAQRAHAAHVYQSCYDDLCLWIDKARAENKTLFLKEHIRFMVDPTALSAFMHGDGTVFEAPWTVRSPRDGSKETHSPRNITILPDRVLAEARHIFLIRHPALTVPSYYRAFVDLHGPEAVIKEEARLMAHVTLYWTRCVYDWLQSIQASSDMVQPMILDGDDFITNPQLLTEVCEFTGMDSSKLQFEWAPATEAELDQLPDTTMRRMRGTLFTSSGVMKEKAWNGNRCIREEAHKWRDEFGDHGAEWIQKWVWKSMPDYEFLKARRFLGKA
ncbi:hypothetical protein N7474_000907 [Penicillium riverlandense]|uniref:uncharacterized protein n=1 Tax=Penicillium riverlandense TaxID=1903569 RepID=UPI002548F925|nr:uncharacterized protein N7474_000907 [Penicillium riverlandense]KAJ5832596.1 hypothetical protein N7474_000907 [Penicillium riverlandense]